MSPLWRGDRTAPKPTTLCPHGKSRWVCLECESRKADDLESTPERMKERISELEAQCAAMREALEVEDAHRPWDGEGLRAALATDAGKAMLEDMRQQSAAFDKLIADRDAERKLLLERVEKAEAAFRNERTDARTWKDRAEKAEHAAQLWERATASEIKRAEKAGRALRQEVDTNAQIGMLARKIALTEMRRRCATWARSFLGPYWDRPNEQFAAGIEALPLEET